MARAALSELPGAEHGLYAFSDFNSPFGVPDVTAIVGQQRSRTARLRLKVPPLLNEIDAGMVAAADPSRPQSVRQLAYRLRWDVGSLERRWPEVLGSGALIAVSPGRFTRPEALVPIGEIFAIETKVKNWRRALQQCRTYLLWADSYVLVLDRLADDSAEELTKAVASDRGGLIVGASALLEPRPSPKRPARKLWASEHVVAELMARR